MSFSNPVINPSASDKAVAMAVCSANGGSIILYSPTDVCDIPKKVVPDLVNSIYLKKYGDKRF